MDADKKILVIDDHAIVRHGICALLSGESGLSVAAEAESVAAALSTLAEQKFDVLLVDVTLKDGTGLDLVRKAREAGVNTPALMLSMHDEETYAGRALKAGAQGYVMKEQADEVIVDAIQAVLQGDIYVSDAVSKSMLRQWSAPEVVEPNAVDLLTQREKQVFEGIGRGLSSKDIAAEFGLSVRTVEVHRGHIKKKIGAENPSQVLREAIRWVEGL